MSELQTMIESSFGTMTKHEYMQIGLELVADARRNNALVSGQLKKNNSIPYTNENLMREIQRHLVIRRDHKILVFYTVEWAIWLKCRGFEHVTVATETHDQMVYKLCAEYGINYESVTSVELRGRTVGEYKGMKFDVIVGNPPFQDAANPGSSKKTWPEFVKLAFMLCKENGYIGMITPPAWLHSKTIPHAEFIEKQSIYVSTDVKKFFPGVASQFSAFVIKNCDRYAETLTDCGNYISPEKLEYLPYRMGDMAISIHNKLKNVDRFTVIDSYDFDGRGQKNGKLSLTPSEKYQYKNRHAAKKPFLYSKMKHFCHDVKKVMFDMSGNVVKPVYDDGDCGITDKWAYIEVAGVEPATILSEYLKSPLITYLINQTSTGQQWNKNFIRNGFPAIDLNQPFDLQSVYRMFDFTEEER